MFWNGKKLESKISELIELDNSADIKTVKVDCASIELTVGSEVYITPSSENDPKVKRILTEKKSQFIIPKGQFALLITEEIVKVPNNALAFISFKAKYKYKGLINVSGFHVDPGWYGKLTFSIYNAGPSDIALEKGDPFALIWYADLDNEFVKEGHLFDPDYVKSYASPVTKMGSNRVSDMTGDIFSPFKLKKELDDLKEKYNKEILSIKEEMHKSEGRLMIRHILLLLGIGGLLIAMTRLDKIIPLLKGLIG
ncbi:dCTP deaminase [Acinetobacter venetianus]|uniref:Deoxycytidine triphosphate deaminase n=1 Tax=Acinetobacter venetianus TaxID=52133 RepID=A0A150HWU3_9GAMM|nr:deoxycytidine triphosphate deaminase [Acinetobacter venetianus]KXZ71560.1 Deoxycytidine triphosphate deaminase [Acinetobacter venetianus]